MAVIQIGNIYMLTTGAFVINGGKSINIEGIGVLAISTAALAELQLIANESSGSARTFYHFVKPTSSTLDSGKPAFEYFPINTILSGVSASVVTACTGWLYLEI